MFLHNVISGTFNFTKNRPCYRLTVFSTYTHSSDAYINDSDSVDARRTSDLINMLFNKNSDDYYFFSGNPVIGTVPSVRSVKT